MRITSPASAGTLESSDVLVTAEPAEALTVELVSTVEKQYGGRIRAVIAETLAQLEVTGARLTVNDRGALDCTIKARVTAACHRAAGSADYRWDPRENPRG